MIDRSWLMHWCATQKFDRKKVKKTVQVYFFFLSCVGLPIKSSLTYWVWRIRDNDVELIDMFIHVGEPVADNQLHSLVAETLRHRRQELLTRIDDNLFNTDVIDHIKSGISFKCEMTKFLRKEIIFFIFLFSSPFFFLFILPRTRFYTFDFSWYTVLTITIRESDSFEEVRRYTWAFSPKEMAWIPKC